MQKTQEEKIDALAQYMEQFDETTKKLLQKYSEKTGLTPRQVLIQAVKDFAVEHGLMSKLAADGKIEFEEIKVKVPKRIMDFLRSMQEGWNQTPIQYIEETIVDSIRSSLESATGQEFIHWFDLAPIFYKILGDERFKTEDC